AQRTGHRRPAARELSGGSGHGGIRRRPHPGQLSRTRRDRVRMNEPGARVISFAGSAVEIRYSGATGRKIVEFLYRDVPDEAEVEPHVHFLIDGVDDQVRLLRGEEVLYEGDSPGRLANLLLGESIYH